MADAPEVVVGLVNVVDRRGTKLRVVRKRAIFKPANVRMGEQH